MHTIDNNLVRFSHYRSITNGAVNSRSGATIAYVQNKDGTYTWAGAFCHPRDNYSKHMGRVKAAGHLRSKKYATTTVTAMTPEEFRTYIDERLADSDGYVRKYKHKPEAVNAA